MLYYCLNKYVFVILKHHSPFKQIELMQKNVGQIDKIIRIVIGVAVIAVGVINQSWWGAVGLVPLLTAFIGFCPLYTVLKISTGENCACNEKPGKNSSCKL